MLGFLNVNKPPAKTSHDVVHALRKLLRVKQVGHGGTLDPLAEGVLPIAVGKATRLLRFLPHNKVYRAEILLGRSTSTDDLEGETLFESASEPPQAFAIEQALKQFVGNLEQIPPLYSAIHYQGQRLYDLARQGILPDDIKPRAVTVDAIDVLSIDGNRVSARISCQTGTYIRSIARDLGNVLGVGGCLTGLLREQSGCFHLSDAKTIDELAQLFSEGRIAEALINPVSALCANPALTAVQVDDEQARRIMMGQKVETPQSIETGTVAVLAGDRLVGICILTEDQRLKPEVIISASE